MRSFVRCVVAVTIVGLGTAAVLADDLETCRNSKDERTIPACNSVIESGKWRGLDLASAYHNRGFAYSRKGDADRAIADYNQAIKLDPNNARLLNNRGNSYFDKHNDDRAITDYSDAVRIDPKYAFAFNGRGNVYHRKGDYDRAFTDYSEAIRLDTKCDVSPKCENAFHFRGLIYLGRGDYDRAIADANEAIKLNAINAYTFKNRGNAYYAKGDYVHAIADYEQAVRLDSTLTEAREGLALAKTATASHEEAIKPLAPFPWLAGRPTQSLQPQSLPTLSLPQTTAMFPSAERRVALVVGNSAYRSDAFLANPRRDAQSVADALRRSGFQTVVLQVDLNRDKMREALRSFRTAADGADWALIYFAGHGIQVGRNNYLIPIDARLNDVRDVKAETISYDELEDTVRGAKALRLIILDACRIDPFAAQMRRDNPDRAPTRGLGPPPESVPGTLVVYSAKDGEVAEDGDGENSPFARAFIAELAMPGLEVRRLFDYVRDDVLEDTKRRQQPFTYGSLPGRKDFYFLAIK